MEVGFDSNYASHDLKFHGHSWSEKWSIEFDRRCREKNFLEVNTFIMLGIDEHNGSEKKRVNKPRSIQNDNLKLLYLGIIEHEN